MSWHFLDKPDNKPLFSEKATSVVANQAEGCTLWKILAKTLTIFKMKRRWADKNHKKLVTKNVLRSVKMRNTPISRVATNVADHESLLFNTMKVYINE